MKPKLCVIDDSRIVCNGIMNHIRWEEHGIEPAGAAMDGEAGLALVRRERPDILITDIRMPRKNGIELFRDVLDLGWPCKVILISGYTDFEYAQEAVRLGAFDFVSKPFLAEEIVAVVNKAKARIEAEREETARVRGLESRVRESLPLLRQEFVQLLLRVASTPEQTAKRWDFLQLPPAMADFVVLAVEIDGAEPSVASGGILDIELARFSLSNILEETVAQATRGVVVRDGLSRFALVLNAGQDADATSQLAELCREHVERYSRHTVSIGVGSPAPTVRELPESYRHALAALSYSFFSGGNSVFRYADLADRPAETEPYSPDSEKELLLYARAGNKTRALEALSAIYAGFDDKRTQVAPDGTASAFLKLAEALYGVLAAAAGKDADARGRAAGELRALRAEAPRTLAAWKETIDRVCADVCDRIAAERTHESEADIQRSVAYIRAHLQESLTVQSLARLACLSTSYFANLFKKQTGVTVAQFIIAERMNRAKELLAEGKQVQEIAAMLGYEDRVYFSDAFKKHTGLTPSEYRQRISG
ncbi:helix-turn-helix domain-containing protein [Cohnella ginsengisoli]|uniref:Helix-turn-helix domain-containing protein n=1 Tax=Cohnella ginsengisoli TaxID=425004 RepID=A0A9X4QRN5_9BACL|nr:helix-turn-helix domain-containing protein [Cohnella ginsengisoli]MDG0795035.1 helix-turn-helix domain-containing protein [Cohnella ginsengisoli]